MFFTGKKIQEIDYPKLGCPLAHSQLQRACKKTQFGLCSGFISDLKHGEFNRFTKKNLSTLKKVEKLGFIYHFVSDKGVKN